MFGNILKRLRQIHGYSSSEMSALLNVSHGYLLEIESNQIEPSDINLTRYSQVLNMKASTIILLYEKTKRQNNYNNNKNLYIRGRDFILNAMIKVITE